MTEPVLITTRGALKEAIRRHEGSSLGLVPTMGALHEGHEALVRAVREANVVVVVTIFVNPLQFGEPQDLERYPRTLDEDLELLARSGADLVFAPSAEEMYPQGEPLVGLDAGRLGKRFEGASRPGHFNGMLTVVSKLFHLAQPAPECAYRAYFGQKDAQQLALIRAMVHDLNFPIEVVAVPTVRNADGLALSSRNRRLSREQQEAALVLSRALRLLEARADAHEPLDPDSAVALVNSQNLVDLDYLEVVDPDTLEALAFNCHQTPFTGTALALIAARVGNVRLIDNLPLGSVDPHPGSCEA
ncbi:pantoate--beta-alanine ligase [Arthrobacter roseus]|uniref:pantoate--beta-alanine ligase n=1 Tax=Arthrobacter roseus TaxID=136274 RepID=UPI00196307B1|nr:pantoate--beta-alanine ligase [Arthrobacter roseus]MBM7847292.1 pantoate--beta-alanine ligase [Arthrobacter roseus]